MAASSIKDELRVGENGCNLVWNKASNNIRSTTKHFLDFSTYVAMQFAYHTHTLLHNHIIHKSISYLAEIVNIDLV